MSPKTLNPMKLELIQLRKLINNLLIENKNFKASEYGTVEAYYFREYPKTYQYTNYVLKDHAEYILERIDSLIEMSDV